MNRSGKDEEQIIMIEPEPSPSAETDWAEFAKASKKTIKAENHIKTAPLRCQACAPVTENLSGLSKAYGLSSAETPEIVEGKRIYVGLTWKIRLTRLVEATSFRCSFCSFVLDKFFCRVRVINGCLMITDASWTYEPERPWYSNLEDTDQCQFVIEFGAMAADFLGDDDQFEFWVVPHFTGSHGAGPGPANFTNLEIRPLVPKTNVERKNSVIQNTVVDVRVFAQEGDPAEEHIMARPPNGFPGSERGIAQVKAWLDECCRSHGGACSYEHSYLPTRVIDVSGGKEIRLRAPGSKEHGQYIALSYCWGGPQKFQTTQNTLQQMTSGFSADELPKTLRDAVSLTHALGIKYIWIDALCIIQDSQEDKNHEINRMADIYKHAYLTICAAKARTVNDGFLHNVSDDGTDLWPNLVPLAYPLWIIKDGKATEDQKCEQFDVGTAWIMDEVKDMYQMFGDPATERAWILQERLLSPRVLYYGRWPMWRCQAAVHTDGGSPSESYALVEPQERHLLRIFRNSATVNPGSQSRIDLFTLNQAYQAWYSTLAAYSKRELSFSSDRLPAIGGIASEFSRVTGAEYLAGLWKTNFVHDLMWVPISGSHEWQMRPDSRCPTWSWASVESSITYTHLTDDSVAEAKFIECEITSAYPEMSFGEVWHGEAIISGPFAQVNRDDVLILLEDQKRGVPQSKNIGQDAREGENWIKDIMKGIFKRRRGGPRSSGLRSKGGEINLGAYKIPAEVTTYDMESLHSSVPASQRRPYRPTQPHSPPPSAQGTLSFNQSQDLSIGFPGDVYALVTFSRDWRDDYFHPGKRLQEQCYSGLLLKEVANGRYERIGVFTNEVRDWMDQTIRMWPRSEIILV